MSDKKPPLKVFLCHATADKPQVRKLYDYLKRHGIQPWLDIVDLLPGQNWRVEIPKVIASSDAIIICLSDSSVDKEGYVQKEIKFALDKALELPEGHIFLIPARLNKCDVPSSLNQYQWVDLFEEGGYFRLLSSLKIRASQLARAEVKLPKTKGTSLESASKATSAETNNSPDKKRRDTRDIGGGGKAIKFGTQSISNTIRKRIPQNKETKSFENEPKLERQNNSRVRFLDALDSARFSFQSIYDDSRLLSVLYVKAQLVFALVTGDSIVITENQFFDSLGFLEAFHELHKAAQAIGSEAGLPLKVALRAANEDVYQSVANNMANESFVLTLWKDLDRDIERRKLWADHIRSKQKPLDETVLLSEKILLDKLWTALEYFDPSRCVPADNIPSEFANRVKRIMGLKNQDLDNLHTGRSMNVQQRKYFSSRPEVEAAQEIRDVLMRIQEEIGEIKTRSLIRRELVNYKNEELREGVIELTDGIYNQTLGIATRATLIQSSTFPPRKNRYVTAGYSLATFVQDTSNLFNYFVNWEIFAFDYFENLEGLDNPRQKDDLVVTLEAARANVPWGKIIKMRGKNAWKRNSGKFQESLTKLQSIVKVYSIGSLTSSQRKELEDERSKYQVELEKNWIQLITYTGRATSNKYWAITPTAISFNHPDPNIQYPIKISYSFLKPKIDMEGDDGYKVWRHYQSFKGRIDSRADLPR